MASVHKRATKKGVAYDVRYRDPVRRSKKKTFRRRVDAERFRSAVEVQLHEGTYIGPESGKTLFADWCEAFMSTQHHLRPTTRSLYTTLVEKHIVPEFGAAALRDIRPVDVHGWLRRLESQGLAPGTVSATYKLFARMMASAAQNGLIARPPAAGVKLKQSAREEQRFLRPEEVSRLADAIGDSYRALVLTAAYTGCRWSELAGLRVGRVHFLRRSIEISETLIEVDGELSFGAPKTAAARRTISIPAALAEELARHLAARGRVGPEGLVFVASDGSPLRRSNFRRRVWQPALRAAGIDPRVRFHDLRHTHVALLTAQGAHPKIIQARLGHSTIRVTLDTYGHLIEGIDEPLVEGLDRLMAQSSTGRP